MNDIGLGKQSAGEPQTNQNQCGAAGFSQFGSPETQQPRFPDEPPF